MGSSVTRRDMDRVKGPWSPEEDEALRRLVQKHGSRSPVPAVRYRLVSPTSPRTRSADPSLLSDRFSSPFMASPALLANVSVSDPNHLGVTTLPSTLGCSALLFCELGGFDFERSDRLDIYEYSHGMRGIRKEEVVGLAYGAINFRTIYHPLSAVGKKQKDPVAGAARTKDEAPFTRPAMCHRWKVLYSTKSSLAR